MFSNNIDNKRVKGLVFVIYGQGALVAKKLSELNSYVRHTLLTLASVGIDQAPYLDCLGITMDELEQADDRITRDQYNDLLDEIIGAYPNLGLGLLDGRGVSLLEHGLLGYAMFASANLSKAIARHSRYQDVIGAALHTRLFVDDRVGRLRVTDISRPELINTPAKLRYETERLLAQWAEIGPVFGATRHWYSRLLIGYPKPTYAGLYNEILGPNISFGADSTEIIFDVDLLQRPLKFANEAAAILCEQQCDALLKQLKNTEGYVARVRRALAANPGSGLTIAQVGKMLGTSERSLRRRLEEEGETFKQVVSNFRMELAASYLKGEEMTIQEVAYTIGYSDPSNFHRAFQKFYGSTPASFRANRLNLNAARTLGASDSSE